MDFLKNVSDIPALIKILVLLQFVFNLQAPHNTFNYFFSGVNTQSDRFSLDSSTGQIYVRRILSGETQNTFTVNRIFENNIDIYRNVFENCMRYLYMGKISN